MGKFLRCIYIETMSGPYYTEILQVVVYSDIVMNTIAPTAPYLLVAADKSQLSTTYFNDFVQYCNTNWQKVYFIVRNNLIIDETMEIRSITSITNNIINYVNENNLTNTTEIDTLFSIMDSFTDDIYMFGSSISNGELVIPDNSIPLDIELRNSILLYVYNTN